MQKELNSPPSNIMLIKHSDDVTWVAIVNKQTQKLIEYNIELASTHSQKGNIYLAQVARIETSLQAAFMEYGSDRHGFLSFNEIHPDYYQIPLADRESLYKEQQKILREKAVSIKQELIPVSNYDDVVGEHILHVVVPSNPKRPKSQAYERFNKYLHQSTVQENLANGVLKSDIKADIKKEYIKIFQIQEVEVFDKDIANKIDPNLIFHQKYRINEVIVPGQVMLVQVIKETKGNKGIPLTTYLSIAGQYCVFIPNSSRNICISHKISDPNERRKIKELLKNIELPDQMGIIIRTAGSNKSLAIIKNDLKNQMRLWEDIRYRTIESKAPCLIYEDSHPITNAIRNMYNDSIADIYVEGVSGYKRVKELVKGFLPSFLKHIHLHNDSMCLFSKYKVQQQILSLNQSNIQLPSGGHIVIHPTEALVAIDVNSGKATKEHNIEETALKTNLEAVTEIATQLRLRNLSGIVVIDFIDMKNINNNVKVENYMKECLQYDPVKTQVGRINNFGLLSLSRQRLNVSHHEIGTQVCSCCNGNGIVLSPKIAAMLVINLLEEYCVCHAQSSRVMICLTPEIVLTLVNMYRNQISQIEKDHQVVIDISIDNSLVYPNFYKIIDTSVVNNSANKKAISSQFIATSSKKKRSSKKYNKLQSLNNAQDINKNENDNSDILNKKEANFFLVKKTKISSSMSHTDANDEKANNL